MTYLILALQWAIPILFLIRHSCKIWDAGAPEVLAQLLVTSLGQSAVLRLRYEPEV